jgi:AraC-like DNA-binding protein
MKLLLSAAFSVFITMLWQYWLLKPATVRTFARYMPQNALLDIETELTQLDKAVYESSREIPGSVRYSIKRFVKPQHWSVEDTGFLHYSYHPSDASKNALELRFCITGNRYCRQFGSPCSQCKTVSSPHCTAKQECLEAVSFVFTTSLLAQFVKTKMGTDAVTDELLAFKHTSSFTKQLPLCNRTRAVLDGLLNHNYTDTLENIYVNAQTQMLLLYSLNCMMGADELDTAGCKFLANEADREKITKARALLIQHIGEPITIKELSRKVAINECYLKKGFKEMFGTTIFDFYQSQRMEHAKYLLYEKGLSVTDVSVLLGYSSISHFSTAFKKHTGLKPCELLLR